MLKTLMENQVIFYAMGIAAGIGLLSMLISHITLGRMVRAASKMSKSNHKLMRLVKAKFEHASMISDKVQNVEAFVKKYVFEYRVFRIRLYTWRGLEKKSIWIVGILGAAGTAAQYYLYGMDEVVFRYGALTGVGVTVLFLIHISSDERYQLQMSENYMIDFLENVCAHRYTKLNQQKELSQADIVQMEREVQEASMQGAVVQEEQEESKEAEKVQETYVAETEKEAEDQGTEKDFSQEIRIREILQEFLA